MQLKHPPLPPSGISWRDAVTAGLASTKKGGMARVRDDDDRLSAATVKKMPAPPTQRREANDP